MAHELERLANGQTAFAPAKTDTARATRALTGAGADLKVRAFELLAV